MAARLRWPARLRSAQLRLLGVIHLLSATTWTIAGHDAMVCFRRRPGTAARQLGAQLWTAARLVVVPLLALAATVVWAPPDLGIGIAAAILAAIATVTSGVVPRRSTARRSQAEKTALAVAKTERKVILRTARGPVLEITSATGDPRPGSASVAGQLMAEASRRADAEDIVVLAECDDDVRMRSYRRRGLEAYAIAERRPGPAHFFLVRYPRTRAQTS